MDDGLFQSPRPGSRQSVWRLAGCILLLLAGCAQAGPRPDPTPVVVAATTGPLPTTPPDSSKPATAVPGTPAPPKIAAVTAGTAVAPPPPAPQPELLRGVGLMGASTLDEYRGSDNRGGNYGETTLNMAELLAKYRGFNLGAWGEWGPPRRTGYAYNWSRSSATSRDMIEQGQHTGLAGQIRRGEVTFVIMHIGGNDFSPYAGKSYARIYDGTRSDEEVQAKIDQAVADVTLAVDTVLDAGAQGMIVALFPSWELDPGVWRKYPNPLRRRRVEQAIAAVNEGIVALAAERNIAVIDSNDFARELLGRMTLTGKLAIESEEIDVLERGNEPHHGRLNDAYGHAGTVISGLMANYYIIEPLNATYHTEIEPFTNQEILANAGIEIGQP